MWEDHEVLPASGIVEMSIKHPILRTFSYRSITLAVAALPGQEIVAQVPSESELAALRSAMRGSSRVWQ